MADWPFKHADRCDGSVLRIVPSVDFEGHAALSTEDGAVRVSAGDLPQVVAALYEAAGLPAPVILDRPEHPVLDLIPGVSFEVRNRGVEGIRRPSATESGTLWEAATIRHFAASLAVLADEAEAAPHPAEVAELAAVIRSGGRDMLQGSGAIARDILRAGWKREPRDG